MSAGFGIASAGVFCLSGRTSVCGWCVLLNFMFSRLSLMWEMRIGLIGKPGVGSRDGDAWVCRVVAVRRRFLLSEVACRGTLVDVGAQ